MNIPKRWPYVCCLIVGLTACSDSESNPVTNNEVVDENLQPLAQIVQPNAGLSIHQGEDVSFESSCDDTDTDIPFTHRWNFAEGNTSEEQSPTHTFNNAGTFDVSYICIDAKGLESDAATVSITTTNAAPVIESFEPHDGLALLPGSVLDFGITCSDSDDPDSVRGIVEFNGVATAVDTPTTLSEIGLLEVVGYCEDPHGLRSTQVTGSINVGPPRALYLSNEQKLDHREVMLVDTPGSPTVLNQDLLAPGGSVSSFIVANEEVFYFADHGVENRDQLYQANASDPLAPRALTTPFASGSGFATVHSSGKRFFYSAQQNVNNQLELFWVNAEATTPTPVTLTPSLVGIQQVDDAAFSPTGRYIAFTIFSPIVQGQEKIFVVDLDAGGAPVEILTGTRYQSNPISFSADERYLLLGGRDLLRAVDLTTLSDAIPTTIDLFPAARLIEDFDFIGTSSLAAIVVRDLQNINVLYVVDIAAEFAGVDQLSEIVYDATIVESTSSAARDLRVCDDGLVFTAEKKSGTSEFYYIDLVAWANDFRTAPGTQNIPERVHENFSGDESILSTFFEFSDDCSKAVYFARRDLDSDPATPVSDTMAWTDFSSLGTSTILDSDSNYRTGGRFPDLSFSPNNTYVTWSETDVNGDVRTQISTLGSPGKNDILPTVDGETDEHLWRDDDTLLMIAQRGSNPGLYEWSPSSPQTPTRFTAGNMNGNFTISADEQNLIYIEEFSSSSNQITKTDLPAAASKEKISGDGTTNGADIARVWSVSDDTLVLFAGEDEVDGRLKLFAVDPNSPRDVQEIFPGDSDPTATVALTTLKVVAANDTVLFQGNVQGTNGLYIADLDAKTAATKVDVAPATFIRFYDVSPDGNHVMFRGTIGDETHLFVKDLSNGGPAVSIYEGVIRENNKATFSPDGRYGTFLVDRNPTYAYVFDVQNLSNGSMPLLPDNYPEEIPRSATEPQLLSTTGATAVGFGATSEWVYFSYDDVYYGHLKTVRRNLMDLGIEEVLSPADVGAEVIDVVEPLEGQDSIIYRKTIFPNGDENGSIDVLVVVDGDTPGVERILTPTLVTQDRGVVSWGVYQDFVALYVDTQDGGSTSYIASIDGSVPAFPLNQTLENNTALRVLGVSTIADSTVAAFTAHQVGDVSPQLYVSTYVDGATTVARFDLGDNISPIASFDEDGHWVYWENIQGGVSTGLFTSALAAPNGPQLQLSATPIVDGSVDLPAATLR